MSNQQNKNRSIQPSLAIGPVSISAGIAFGKSSTIGYETRYCVKCHNTDVDVAYGPFTYISSDDKISVIIPYTLYVLLKTCEYNLGEIPHLIQGLRDRLHRIYLKWSKTGNNQCEGGRVGYKLMVELKRIDIACWVIVDFIENRISHRLVYGGAKINCP